MNNEHEKVTFSANLLRLMNENNKTRNEVSSETGIKYATLCEWINCRKYPRIDKIRLLADYFHVEKSELIEDRRYGERIGLTGERIRSLRIERNITQTELAAKINATKQTVYKYEQGIIANIPYDKMELLAEALNTTPAYLMGWEEKESNCTAKETMARNIKSYMNVGHISKQQLCNDLGFKYTTFLDWINAATYPRIEKIEAMADYFNCSKSDLIEEHCSGDFMSFENVNKLKKEKGLTNETLAELSGVPKSTVAKIASGITRNPSIKALQAIAKALGCSLDDLCSGKDPTLKGNIALSKITNSEFSFVQKYRRLDSDGQHLINIVIDAELERCERNFN